MTDTMPDAVAASGWRSVPPVDAIARVPLVLVSDAACVDAVTFDSDVRGWQLRDDSGVLVARAVGRPDDGDGSIVDDADSFVAAGAVYHQDWIGSGQNLAGWVLDRRVEAVTNLAYEGRDFVRFSIEIPGYVLPAEGPADGSAGSELLGRLVLAELVPLQGHERIDLPAVLPSGYARCSGTHVWVAQVPGMEGAGFTTTFCNSDDDTIVIGHLDQYNTPLSPPDPGSIDIHGIEFTIWRGAIDEWIVTGPISYIAETLAVQAPAELTIQDITAMIESITSLDPRRSAPADGTKDLHPFYSSDWITQLFLNAGAINLEVKDAPPFVPGTDPFEVTFQVTSLPAPLAIKGYIDTYTDAPSDWRSTDVQTIGDVDVFSDRPGTEQDPIGQAVAYCGGVLFNFLMDRTVSYADLPEDGPIQGDPVLDTLIAVLNQLDC